MAKKSLMLVFCMVFVMAALGTFNLVSAADINDTFHINLQTTFSNGSIQNGTFTFSFNITESSSASCLTPIVYNHTTTLATDSRGIASLYLPTTGSGGGNLSALDFDKQYYLCYYRDGTLKDVSQLRRVPYSFRATQVNLSEVSIDSNLSLGNFWAFLNRTGINTTTPQNLLNVIGDINATTSIFSYGLNLTTGYGYALNATSNGISWANANNGTLLNYSSALNGTLATWANVGNGTVAFWSNVVNGTMASWANVVNGTMLSYAQALNNTLMQQANWNATNTSYYLATNPSGFFNTTGNAFTTFNITTGNFTINNQTTYNLFVVNGTNGRVGIVTNTSQNTLNVIGDINATTTVFSQNKNLSLGYDYAINSSTDTFIANYTNFTVIYGYALNDSLWTLNYSDFLVTRSYSLNDSLWTLNYTNFTNIYANVTDYNASWTNRTNLTYFVGSSYATNGTYYLASNPTSFF